jgi:hypothetical protein
MAEPRQEVLPSVVTPVSEMLKPVPVGRLPMIVEIFELWPTLIDPVLANAAGPEIAKLTLERVAPPPIARSNDSSPAGASFRSTDEGPASLHPPVTKETPKAIAAGTTRDDIHCRACVMRTLFIENG